MSERLLHEQSPQNPQEGFYDRLREKHLLHYEGCGNQLGVVPLTLAGYPLEAGDAWKADPTLRKMLTEWGREINSDSVMVITGDPLNADEQKYHVSMTVFEPNGDDGSGLGGGLSTMCGNGIRAVARYVQEYVRDNGGDPDLRTVKIKSGSGERNVEIEGENFVVDMGEFTTAPKDLAQYVRQPSLLRRKGSQAGADGRYIDAPIPAEIQRKLADYTSAKTWSIGLNGTRNEAGAIDGEPHIIIEIPRNEVDDIDQLRALAVAAGPVVTKNLGYFPGEINVNFVVYDHVDDEGRLVIWNATHERNLGDDADHSVTAACGTGSTVAGGVMFEKYGANAVNRTVVVKNTGGDLEITPSKTEDKSLLMKGPANKVIETQ
ncbi:MAG TPA: hypothetical protein VF941_15190 [Clostridia bacterium]